MTTALSWIDITSPFVCFRRMCAAFPGSSRRADSRCEPEQRLFSSVRRPGQFTAGRLVAAFWESSFRGDVTVYALCIKLSPGFNLLTALKAASFAAQSIQRMVSGNSDRSIRSSSSGVKTRAMKRRSRLFPTLSGLVKSTISLPMLVKVFLLHLGQAVNNLPRQVPLRP